MTSIQRYLSRAGAAGAGVLTAYSVLVLRVAMGAVFAAFGVLKFFPGLSPAQDLAVTTTRILTFGLVPDHAALVGVAALECTIGMCLILGGRLLPVGLVLLAPELAGILSPVVLLAPRLFPGLHHGPTLEAQYVLKDVILVGAAMVIAADLLTRRAAARAASSAASSAAADPAPPAGGFLPATVAVPTALAVPTGSRAVPRVVPAREKLAIVLAGMREECPLGELCDRHGVDEADYQEWKEEIVAAAAAITSTQAYTALR